MAIRGRVHSVACFAWSSTSRCLGWRAARSRFGLGVTERCPGGCSAFRAWGRCRHPAPYSRLRRFELMVRQIEDFVSMFDAVAPTRTLARWLGDEAHGANDDAASRPGQRSHDRIFQRSGLAGFGRKFYVFVRHRASVAASAHFLRMVTGCSSRSLAHWSCPSKTHSRCLA